MASPVDTSVKHFTSALANAPVLNGQAGSLITVLDACLVTGYGQQTATSIVVADGVATVTLPSAFPAKVDQVILVAGATPSGLNGEQKITAIGGSNVVRFATEESDGTASGTITVKLAAAGWVKEYSGTNKAVYRSPNPQALGGGMCLRVDDSGTTSARVIGYETMSDVDTGTGPFPSTAMVSGGGYWVKSLAANSTAVTWAIVADDRFFLFFVGPTTAHNHGVTRGFGDPIVRRPTGDPYAVFLNCSSSSTPSAVNTMHDGALDGIRSTARCAVPRTYTGLGSASWHAARPYSGQSVSSGSDNAFGNFPSYVSGELLLSYTFLANSVSSDPPRADIPGILHIPQAAVANSIKWFDVVAGTGQLSGRNLLAVTPAASGSGLTSAGDGCALIDITGPWR